MSEALGTLELETVDAFEAIRGVWPVNMLAFALGQRPAQLQCRRC